MVAPLAPSWVLRRHRRDPADMPGWSMRIGMLSLGESKGKKVFSSSLDGEMLIKASLGGQMTGWVKWVIRLIYNFSWLRHLLFTASLINRSVFVLGLEVCLVGVRARLRLIETTFETHRVFNVEHGETSHPIDTSI